MLQTLFTVEGRVGRASWWLGQLCCTSLCIFAIAIVTAGAGGGASIGLAALALLASLWINVCVTIKRYHDLGKSGAWFMIIFIPLVGPMWQIVECGFVSGSFEANDYGPPAGTRLGLGASGSDEPGPLATKDIDFSKYRLSEPVIVSGGTPAPARAPTATKPTFGKRV